MLLSSELRHSTKTRPLKVIKGCVTVPADWTLGAFSLHHIIFFCHFGGDGSPFKIRSICSWNSYVSLALQSRCSQPEDVLVVLVGTGHFCSSRLSEKHKFI